MGLDISDKTPSGDQFVVEDLQLLQTIADFIPSAIFIFQGDSMCYVNPTAQSITGYSKDELLAMPFWALVHEDSREMLKQRGRARQAGADKPANYDVQWVHKDGEVRWFNLRVSMIDLAGKPAAMGVADDITERKQSEERFSLAMRGANDGLWDWNLETDEVYYSPRWKSMLGYEERELEATLDTWTTLVHPDDRDRVLEKVQDYLEKRADSFEVEMRMRHKDGHEVIVLSRAFLVHRESDGKPVRLVGTHVDITERKQAEARNLEQSNLLEMFYKHTHDGIALLDRDFNFIRVNEAYAKACERDVSEFPGHNHFEFYPSELIETFQNTVKTKEPFHIQARPFSFPEHPDWGVTYWDLSLTPVLNDVGEVEFLLFTLKDVTEFKALEGQLLQSQKMEAVGTLVGGIAHDFNNTLAGITGNLYLAKKESKDNYKTLKHLENIENLSFHAADMIQQLLSFSRKGVVNMQPIIISSFLREIIRIHSVAIPENINLHHSFETGDMRIMGDINQLQQVIMNLMNNARDAVSGVKKPEIWLQLEKYVADIHFKKNYPEIECDEFACISVIDNGSGIEEADFEHIFEPFFTTKGVGEGTGLGLAMIYGAIQSHGGVITVDSVPGKGTTFRLYLPLLKSSKSQIDGRIEKEIVPGHGETILLVDDNHDVIEAGQGVLESLGYKVITAVNGLNAVEIYKAQGNSINLIVLDMVMPEMGGPEAAEEIRRINKDAKVIFLTGYDSAQQLNTASIISDKVLSKPFKVDELSQIIKATLDSA